MRFVRTPGQAIGKESTTAKRNSYPYAAVADGPTILALVYREDYMRICATGDVQNTIDQFWVLGYVQCCLLCMYMPAFDRSLE